MLLGIDDRGDAVEFDIGGGDRAGLADLEFQCPRHFTVTKETDLLEIQDDVGDIFDDILDRREFVGDAVDLNRGDGDAIE